MTVIDRVDGSPAGVLPQGAWWANPWASVRGRLGLLPSGAPYQHTTVRAGTGMGAVIIPLVRVRGRAHLGLVEVGRPAVGHSSLEFPRGGTDDLDEAEARRELVEETGLVPSSMRRLAVIEPDTGLLDTQVGIWIAHIADSTHVAAALAQEGFLDPETGSCFAWYPVSRLEGRIRAGHVRCGLTLAAWGLLRTDAPYLDIDA